MKYLILLFLFVSCSKEPIIDYCWECEYLYVHKMPAADYVGVGNYYPCNLSEVGIEEYIQEHSVKIKTDTSIAYLIITCKKL